MRLTIRRDLGGYALDAVLKAGIDHTRLDEPFTLLSGPNGAGKSAVVRAMRATIGLRGERAGHLRMPFGERELSFDQDDDAADIDIERLNTHVVDFGKEKTAAHVPFVFDLRDLGWKGQPTYLFDAREVSSMTKMSSFDDDGDMGYQISQIAGGTRRSHGQFVSGTWWEAVEWACGLRDVAGGWTKGTRMPIRKALHDRAVGTSDPSTERWLFLDEPELAIDAETFVLGMSVLLKQAEIGRLRVFCASHSMLFPAGLAEHPKVQVVDLADRSSWMDTQKIALRLASDATRLSDVGGDILDRMRQRRESEASKGDPEAGTPSTTRGRPKRKGTPWTT